MDIFLLSVFAITKPIITNCIMNPFDYFLTDYFLVINF